MDIYDNNTDLSSRGIDAATTEKRGAAPMAADAFRQNHVHPADCKFADRQPQRRSVVRAPKTWHGLGEVLADVLRDLGRENDEAA